MVLKHGYASHPLYQTWAQMIQRCTNSNAPKYKLYGGRGITVCDAWLTNVEAFITYMGDKPSPKHTLDRINGNGNYEPGNVRWATSTEQSLNRDFTRWITYKARTQHLSAWARELGITYQALHLRIKKYGVDRAIEIGGTHGRSHLS